MTEKINNYKKVILVNPPMDFDVAMGKIKNLSKSFVQIPLGIAYLAAFMQKNDVEVKIIDAYAEALSIDAIIDRALKENCGILGINCVTAAYPMVCAIARRFKEKNAGGIVVLGGEHPTVLPDEALSMDCIDYVIRGEAELTFIDLIKTLGGNPQKMNEVQGVSFKTGGNIVHNQDRPLIENLDIIPFPAYELLPMHLYTAPPHWEVASPAFQMITSRGCPYKCTFCSLGVMTKKRRSRSPENVVREIKQLVEKYHAKQIMFWDAIFPITRKEGMAFSKAMVDSGLNKKVVWTSECHANVADQELFHALYESGCRLVCFGIESGNQEILDSVQKSLKIDQIKKAVACAKRAKIKTYGSYILGLPGETKETALKTIAFAKDVDTDYAQFNMIVPYPGTQMYAEMVERGEFTPPENWGECLQANTFTEFNPVYVPESMTQEELTQLTKKAYGEFYMRPKMVFRHMMRMRSKRDLKRNFDVGRALLQGIFT